LTDQHNKSVGFPYEKACEREKIDIKILRKVRLFQYLEVFRDQIDSFSPPSSSIVQKLGNLEKVLCASYFFSLSFRKVKALSRDANFGF